MKFLIKPSIKLTALLFALLTSVGTFAATATAMPRSASSEEARVYIISPVDGETVKSPVTVRFGLKGMGVAPAGVDKVNTGHHHLLVDSNKLPPMDQPMGADVTHFGAGQTETTITLTPGSHTLQLILGDKFHIPHNPPVVSEVVHITVK
ncbi:MAG: DUF4399 domain-containing protein [Spongiibacteraceae bacterium]